MLDLDSFLTEDGIVVDLKHRSKKMTVLALTHTLPMNYEY